MIKPYDQSKIIADLEKIRLELDYLIRKIDYNNPAWQNVADAKDELGKAQINLGYKFDYEISRPTSDG